MDVWKISETTARKLARDGAEMKRVLHYDKSSSSTLISTATRAFLGLQNEAQRFTPDPAIDSPRPRLIKAWA
ncbi:MAG: hypothetical protein H0T65_11095, partial [Deltaproteobacteria bacterium]|nr:hypothetical protein [Deltaproteobacteria bacterium]